MASASCGRSRLNSSIEDVELCLLLEDIGASRTGGLLLQSQMHAFVSAVLLRMAGANAFDRDAHP